MKNFDLEIFPFALVESSKFSNLFKMIFCSLVLFKLLFIIPNLFGFKELPSPCAQELLPPPLSLIGIVVSNDISSSVATLRDDKTGKLKNLKVGESINNFLIVKILKDKVILKKDKKVYEIFLKNSRPIKAEEKSLDTVNEPSVPSQEIKRLSFAFDRPELMRIIRTEWPLIIKGTRFVSNFIDGEVCGFKITRLPRRSILSEFGIFKHDVIREINGIELNEGTDPYQLIELIKGGNQIDVRVERGNIVCLITYIFR